MALAHVYGQHQSTAGKGQEGCRITLAYSCRPTPCHAALDLQTILMDAREKRLLGALHSLCSYEASKCKPAGKLTAPVTRT